MSEPYRLSLERLQRLRPSDIAKIRALLEESGGVEHVERVFLRYLDHLPSLSDLSAAERDDLTCITLQLREAGFWDRAFLPQGDLREVTRPDVWSVVMGALRDAPVPATEADVAEESRSPYCVINVDDVATEADVAEESRSGRLGAA
jgi:hypothetical protein